ncbi:hypothetical protein [Endozoicomonas sp.]|uniref:hypothetical protein n=1 Tax=Endozoicomonas sp. TaxID=1892382 RepID=UPI0028856318|nr:hypothetical protein [Endozoicomonas sp.]
MFNDDQENPWPGFVDVMSSTLLVFVFLVIIQLIVMAGISLKIDQKVTGKLETIANQPATASETSNQKSLPKTLGEEFQFTLIYSNLDAILTEENRKNIGNWIKQHKALLLTSNIQVSAFLGQKGLSRSTSSFVSFSRLMLIRDELVKQGIPTARITIRISDKVMADDNHILIQILN